jgi:hypothetical protein
MILRKLALGTAMVLLLGLAALAATPRALAEDPNRQTQLKISIWPEYDQPTVLVMFDGTLADATNLPREIPVLIPASASLTVTTYENTDGTLAAEQPYKSTDQGDGYKRVTFSVKTAQYHVEYYDNLLRGAPDKAMDVSFKAAAPVDQLTFDIQQPLKATNFSVNPAAPTTRNDNGFNYYTLPFSSLALGQVVTAQVKYTKTAPDPSVSATPAAAPATAPVPVSSPSIWSNTYIVFAVVLLGFAAVLGFLMLRARSPRWAAVGAGAARRTRSGRQVAGNRIYCTQCGRELGPEDNFCPKCGAARRKTNP